MGALDKFQRMFRSTTKKQSNLWLEEIPAWLGNHSGTVLTGIDGMIFVRTVEGQVLLVYNTVAPAEYNILVTIGRRKDQPNLWQVIGRREVWSVPSSSSMNHHHKQHEGEDAPDAVFISRKQVMALNVLVKETFTVQVIGSLIVTASGVVKIGNQTMDLASYVVTEGAKFVSIETDEDGVLSVNDGTPFEAPALATAADIPVPDDGKHLIATVLMYEGQTQLSNSDIRIPTPLSGGSSTGGSLPTPVAADDFIVSEDIGGGVFEWARRSLADIVTTLRTLLDSVYSAITHDHSGVYEPADADIQSHLVAAAPHSGHSLVGHTHSGSEPDQFGNGADGDAILDGTNTYSWANKSGSTYTLNRIVYLNDLTVDSGVTLIGGGFQLFVNGTLDNSGTIHNDGSNAASNVAGAGGLGNPGITSQSGAYYPSGTDGGAGVASGSGGANGATSPALPVSNSLMGGRGGRGGGAFATAVTFKGGHSGTAMNTLPMIPRSGKKGIRQQLWYAFSRLFYAGSMTPWHPGMGGGGGAKSTAGTSCHSGAGGGGGGALLIAARNLINQVGARISCNGGNGGNAGGAAANAAGGAGGGGGLLWIIYGTFDNQGTISADGGTGGSSSAGGSNPTRAVGQTIAISQSGNPILALTPTAGGGGKDTLYFVTTHQQGGTLGTPSVTGWGLTWQLVTFVDFNSIATPTRRLCLFWAYGTPDIEEGIFGNITVTFPNAPTTCFGIVDEIQNASNVLIQNITGRSDSTNNLGLTLSAVGSANNPIFATFGMAGGTARVAGTNFSLLSNPGTAPITASEIAHNDNTPNMTWTTAVAAGGIAVEIQAIGAMENGQDGEDGFVGLYQA